MKWKCFRVFTALAVCLSAGCTSYESSKAAASVQSHMSDELSFQVLDNLIRAYNGLPFIHLDIQQTQNLVEAQLTPKVTAGRTETTNSVNPRGMVVSQNAAGVITGVNTTVGGAGNVLGNVVKPWGLDISGSRRNASTITGTPVYKEPDVYFAYTEYLNSPPKTWEGGTVIEVCRIRPVRTSKEDDAKDPAIPKGEKLEFRTQTTVTKKKKSPTGEVLEIREETTTALATSPKAPPKKETPVVHIKFDEILSTENDPKLLHALQITPHKPSADSIIPGMVRKWNGKWYCIPKSFRQEFSELCLSVVARGVLQAGAYKNACDNPTDEQREVIEAGNGMSHAPATPAKGNKQPAKTTTGKKSNFVGETGELKKEGVEYLLDAVKDLNVEKWRPAPGSSPSSAKPNGVLPQPLAPPSDVEKSLNLQNLQIQNNR